MGFLLLWIGLLKMKIKKEVIKAYALKNAVEHGGEATVGPVIKGLFNEGLEKSKIKDIMPEVNEVLKWVNSLDSGEQGKEFELLKKIIGKRPERDGLPELDNVKGKVIMRFSPSASGPLHVGHALTACTSFLYTQKYGGKFYVRIEDTNPDNIYKPAYKMIERESMWLFGGRMEIVIQSKRMALYYKYAERLITNGVAYVCTCKPEEFKEFVSEKMDCPCRNSSESESLDRWKLMLSRLKGSYKSGEAVLRFKSDMGDKNPAMRDFPLARINTTAHPIQKSKYKVWPLMNLAVAVDDIEMKMTHVIRAKDHRDNAKRQKMIYSALGKEKQFPETYFLGRIHLKDMELSTSKIREEIKKGKYKGWDDKRLLTLASLKKQGYKPGAFYGLSEQIGLNEVDKTWDKKEFFLLLDNFNK